MLLIARKLRKPVAVLFLKEAELPEVGGVTHGEASVRIVVVVIAVAIPDLIAMAGEPVGRGIGGVYLSKRSRPVAVAAEVLKQAGRSVAGGGPLRP